MSNQGIILGYTYKASREITLLCLGAQVLGVGYNIKYKV